MPSDAPSVTMPLFVPGTTTVFLHIPRTAGTTLNAIFERFFSGQPQYRIGRNGTSHIEDCSRFIALLPERRAGYAYVTGHLEMPVIKAIPGRPFVFTFLRHPVTRLISLYAFVKRTPSHHMHAWLTRTGASLETFVARCPWDEVQNGMTRRLAGVPLARSNDKLLLLRAIASIKRYFAFIGLQESFDVSLACLGKLLGIEPAALAVAPQNVNPDAKARDAVDQETTDAILYYNALDCMLYDFCRKLFAAERARLHDGTESGRGV